MLFHITARHDPIRPVAEEKGASRGEANNSAGDCLWYQPSVILRLNSFARRSRARRDRPRGFCKPCSHFPTVDTDTPSFLANFSWLRPKPVRSLTTSSFWIIILIQRALGSTRPLGFRLL